MYPVVILAAGESSRFWPLNERHKSLFYLMGKPILWWILKQLKEFGFKKIFIVQSPKRDIEKELKKLKIEGLKITYLLQQKPLGTGNALWQARNFLKEPFFVLNGDLVCLKEILKAMLPRIKKEKKPILAGQVTTTPQIFGIMQLRGDRILKIVEKPKEGKEPSKIKVVGLYFLEPQYFQFYRKVKKDPFDFENALSLYMKENVVKVAMVEKDERETPAFIKYPWHLFSVKEYLFDEYLKSKIEERVRISRDVLIEGKVYIGKGTRIFEKVVIKGSCYIGENCQIGNFSLIRDSVNLEDNVMAGAFCEIKNSIFQKNSTTHSGYFGDSIFDENVKIGAGTITSNIRLDRQEIFCEVKGKKINTHLKSFGTVIGKGTVLGSFVNVMPGKFVGPNLKILPNSIISKNLYS